jgi:predicted dehydrogenase
MNHPIRLGIVGCGSVMEHYMETAAPHFASGNLQLTIACDTRPARRDFMQQRFAAPRVTDRYLDVTDSPDVDLVLVLTSMNEHGPIAHAALKAGKHVLVEKPMSTSLDEAAAMVETARTSPGYLVVAPHVILSPTFQQMARHIRRGDIGKVCAARAAYGWSGPEWGRWFYLKGGGPIFDLGVYNITALTGWLGPARRVMALTGQAIPVRMVEGEPMHIETEDNAQILLDFGDACFASVFTGFTIHDRRAPAIDLYGSDGVIQMLGNDWAPEGYELLQRGGEWQCFPTQRDGWPWTDGLNHLIACIRSGARPIITPEHAYHVLDVMLKAMQSGREGKAIDLTSSFAKPAFD